MSQVRTTTGRHFEANAEESLLDAALRAGIGLPYSCRTGRCGTCKGRVHRGTAAPIHQELGLDPAEAAAGWILTCVRAATTDLDIEVEDLGDVRLAAPRTLPCRVHSLDTLAPDVLRVSLRLPPNGNFDYRPGQYIDVIGHGGLRRSYSIGNAPTAGGLLELHIRRVPGGKMSAYWFGQAQVNDLLRLNGPLGTFFLRDAHGLDLVFLATGTGMAPVKAMLEGAGSEGAGLAARSISVYWGGRVPEDLYWNPSAAGDGVAYTPVLSRADAGWKGMRGHVQHALLASGRDWQRTAVYACGSEAMIHDARTAVVRAGLDPRRFHSDAFVCSASAL